MTVRRALRPLVGASFGVFLSLLCAPVRAQDHPLTTPAATSGSPRPKPTNAASSTKPEPRAAAEPAPESAPANDDAAAERAYAQALAKYAKKDISAALDSMKESYRLCQRPELLYNIAVLERELHECRPALDDYAGYLARVPQGRYRDAAQQASIELAAECPAITPLAAAELAPAANAPPAQPPTGGHAPPAFSDQTAHRAALAGLGWSALGAAVLAGAGTVYFTHAAISARDGYQQSVNASYEHGTPRDPSLQERQHRDQRLAQAFAVSAGALVAGGALILIFGSRRQQQSAPHAELHVQPGWLEACYTQAF